MPFDKTVLANLGGTEPHNGEYRAHLQLRDEEGTKIHICGTLRPTEVEVCVKFVQLAVSDQLGRRVSK